MTCRGSLRAARPIVWMSDVCERRNPFLSASRIATRRRALQQKYEEHGIEPATIIKSVDSDLVRMANLDYYDVHLPGHRAKLGLEENEDIDKAISRLTKGMKEAAKNLDFERAAEIRDKVRELKEVRIFV
jgi:excinuclease ABC subunit B